MENQTFSEMFQRYTSLLLRWIWLLVLAAVLAGGAAYLVSKQMMPIYQASTMVLIDQAPDARTSEYSAILASQRLSATYSEMLTTRPVLEEVIQQLDLDMTVRELAESINIEPVRETQLIKLKVENPDPVQAAQIANTTVEVFTEYNRQLQEARYAKSKDNLQAQIEVIDAQIQETVDALAALDSSPENQIDKDNLTRALSQYRQTYASLVQSYEEVRVREAQSTTGIVQLEEAVPPEYPVRPRVMLNTMLAVIVGLMLAVGAVFLIEALDDTLHGPVDVSNYLDLPVLGMVAKHQIDGDKLVTVGEPRSLVSEAFRSLRTNIQFASVDTQIRTLLVTSPSPSDGKTIVAANLAAIVAQSGREVVLLDADLRRPRVHKMLDLSNRNGVSGLFVQDNIQLDGALNPTEVEHLFVVTSGETPPNPAELLGSEKMTEILDVVKQQADLVIIDSPPVMAVTDASVLAPRVDGVLLVLKPGETRMAAARQTVEQLQRVGANVLGVVLNEVDLKRSRYSYYYYRGYYTASKEYSDSSKVNQSGGGKE